MKNTHVKSGEYYITKNYGMFKKLLGNRDVKEERVEAIAASMLKVGCRRSPIVVNKNLEVIDGQGRLAACEMLGIPVYYIIDEDAGIDECIAMNIRMRNWLVDDFIKSFADRGFEDYRTLVQLYDKYQHHFSYLTIAKTMSATLNHAGVRKCIISGNYQIAKDKDGIGCLNFFDAMYETILQMDGRDSSIYDVLTGLYLYNLIDIERMIEQFNKYADYSASYMGDVNSCLDVFQSIYNYRKKTKFYFKDKYRSIMDERLNRNKKVEDEEV